MRPILTAQANPVKRLYEELSHGRYKIGFKKSKTHCPQSQ